MKILVTGAAGQLGSDVVEAAARSDHDVIGLGSAELDLTELGRAATVLQSVRPDAVVSCAAYTAVDAAESEQQRAFDVNSAGVAALCDAAHEVGSYLIHVSTDYVFDGSAGDGYVEDHATDPINVYGASKLAGENAVLEYPQFAVARTAWLFGRRGQNFVKTIEMLAASRDSIEVVDDQRGCPTYTGHLATALVAACEARLSGILHLVDAPVGTWFDLAKEVVAAAGHDCEVLPTTTDRFPRPAPRPSCSVLLSTRSDAPAMGDWRDGVRAVLTQPATAG